MRIPSGVFNLARSRWNHTLSTSAAPLLVTPSEVNKWINTTDRQLSLLEASWFMPNSPRKPREEFLSKRIPGSQFLDLDQVASPHQLGLKHMMPSLEQFADACESFGISRAHHVVIYDSQGIFSSPRALFMFRSFGHLNSSVIDGGLPRWEAEDLPLATSRPSTPERASYPLVDVQKPSTIKEYSDMVRNSHKPVEEADLVLDARSRGRYLGIDPEPRPGLPSGHIPGSFSLPFDQFLHKHTADNGLTYTTFRSAEEIFESLQRSVGSELANAIARNERQIVTTCGSGMTAGILWLGLQLIGTKQVDLYDESWTGYAMRPSSQIAVSPSDSRT